MQTNTQMDFKIQADYGQAEKMSLNSLSSLSDSELHLATSNLVNQERGLSILILDHLREVSSRRLYAEMSYSSLFEYCVKALKYSEAQAYRRVTALRMSAEIPEVREMIQAGKLNLATITQAQGFFNREEKTEKLSSRSKKEVLESLVGKTQREVEVKLSEISSTPHKTKPDRRRVLSSDLTQVSYTQSAQLKAKLEKLTSLLSHELIDTSHDALLNRICDVALEHLDPEILHEKRMHRQKQRELKKTKATTTNAVSLSCCLISASERLPSIETAPKKLSRSYRRKSIPASIKHEVWIRDRGQCTFIDSRGIRCISKPNSTSITFTPLQKVEQTKSKT